MLVPVHRDGYAFIAAFALAALLLFWIWDPLGWLGVAATAWCVYFFRDPPRVTPTREGLVVAPGDGRICAIDNVVPPPDIDVDEKPRVRISIFLSIFDVHINRAPVGGRVARSVHIPGRFLNAELDRASRENERQCLTIETASGVRVGCVQVAGLVARRIVTFVSEGATVAAGERIGLIRFGSRVDVYLPPGCPALVAVGQRAVGGETVFAELNAPGAARDASAG